MTGLKKVGAYLYCAPYMHETSFWGVQNNVPKRFCTKIILLQNLGVGGTMPKIRAGHWSVTGQNCHIHCFTANHSHSEYFKSESTLLIYS